MAGNNVGKVLDVRVVALEGQIPVVVENPRALENCICETFVITYDGDTGLAKLNSEIARSFKSYRDAARPRLARRYGTPSIAVIATLFCWLPFRSFRQKGSWDTRGSCRRATTPWWPSCRASLPNG